MQPRIPAGAIPTARRARARWPLRQVVRSSLLSSRPGPDVGFHQHLQHCLRHATQKNRIPAFATNSDTA